ncbi:MAG: hypothetical protein PHS30_02160 [Bacteroidales bacterium]|nr:hypothetical protein [Bacteroidales bacterium]
MFWLLKDAEIEQPALLQSQFDDLKKAGFTSLYVMLRSTRYHIFDKEVIAVAKRTGEMCRQNNIKFIFGLDPRFGAIYITRKSGYGAQILLTVPDYFTDISAESKKETGDIKQNGLNEQKIVQGKYSLKYTYPSRRDTHILTEVSMWYNPIGVDKVYAYRRENGKVITSSVRDITSGHHFFINRSFYYIEIFGEVYLPDGEWYVTAFPRFMTNMYAYESKEQQQIFEDLIGEYKKQDVKIDGIVWDEPGYYVNFGKYVVSEQLYADFQKKYGYDLKSKLYALTLTLDDESQIKVRNDYFELLMDYVFGGEKRCRDIAKRYYGKMRMGIHATWHDIVSEDMFHGTGNLWRGFESVDGGYTDGGSYENYFTDNQENRFAAVAYMIIAKGLARFSESKKAHFNQWGVHFDNQVPVYWNDLMAAFSNEWINHSYGYTGVIGADRSFGPGYPDHESWNIMPDLVAECKKVNEITSYNLPLGESVIIYPNTTLLGSWAVEGVAKERRILALIGAMPAMGLQTDVIGSNLLDEAEVKNGRLVVRGHIYNAVFLPYNEILSSKSVHVLQQMIAQKGRIYFGGNVPQQDLDGKVVDLKVKTSFSLSGDIEKTMSEVSKLKIPSGCTQLKGAYLNLIPSDDGKMVFLTVMPIVPNTHVGGAVVCFGQKVEIGMTKSLAIYEIKRGVKPKKVFNTEKPASHEKIQ